MMFLMLMPPFASQMLANCLFVCILMVACPFLAVLPWAVIDPWVPALFSAFGLRSPLVCRRFACRCRFVGGRRRRLARVRYTALTVQALPLPGPCKHCSFGRSRRADFVTRAAHALAVFPVVRCIFHSVGLLATRVGEAGHPGPVSDGVGPIDPWASYLASKMPSKSDAPPAAPSKKSANGEIQRAPWTSCSLDLTQLQDASDLSSLSLADFCEGAEGVALLTRPLFAQVSRVRSKGRLLVVLPGGDNSDLTALGLGDSSFQATHMFLYDPNLQRTNRKLVTLVQLGATAVLPATLADSPEWDVPQTCEFSIIMSSRLFPNAEAWSSFLTDSRKTVVQSVLQLDKALTSDNTEFWGWKKIDANTQRASFRARANQKTALLAASGVRVPFIIQDLCRNQADMDDRDKSCAVVWLGRRTYGASLVLLKQVVGNLGFALNSQSFGVRVKPTGAHTAAAYTCCPYLRRHCHQSSLPTHWGFAPLGRIQWCSLRCCASSARRTCYFCVCR